MSRRLGFRLLLGVLVLLLAGHGALWFLMVRQLESGVAAWAQLRRDQGWVVDYGAPVRGGWPLAATLELPGLHLAGGQASLPGGIDWRAGTARLAVVIPRFDTLEVALPDPQRLLTGWGEIPIAAQRMELRVPLTADPPRPVRVVAEKLHLGTPAGPLEIGSLWGTIDGRANAAVGEPVLSVLLQSQQVQLPVTTPLGPAIAQLDLDAAIGGPSVPGGQAQARARAWRDAGGAVEVNGLTLRWGPLTLAGAATVALDEQLQPKGAGAIRAAGVAETLEALASGGMVNRRAATTAKTVVAMMANQAGEVEVPLALDNGTLSVARMPMLRLGSIVWP